MINSEYTNDTCEICKDKKMVKWRLAMTAYYWNGKGEDPNRNLLLCDECWKKYYDYYDELWKEYYYSKF